MDNISTKKWLRFYCGFYLLSKFCFIRLKKYVSAVATFLVDQVYFVHQKKSIISCIVSVSSHSLCLRMEHAL